MSTKAEEWIGVEDVAAEMKFTQRQAWEYVRRIGLASANGVTMKLARFTRADFEAARERAMRPLAPRARAGAATGGSEAAEAGPRAGAAKNVDWAALAASRVAKIRRK